MIGAREDDIETTWVEVGLRAGISPRAWMLYNFAGALHFDIERLVPDGAA